VRKYQSLGYAVDRAVDDIKTLFNYPPLFNYHYQLVSEFRDFYMNTLSRKNIYLGFEDIEERATYMPSLSGQNGGGT